MDGGHLLELKLTQLNNIDVSRIQVKGIYQLNIVEENELPRCDVMIVHHKTG